MCCSRTWTSCLVWPPPLCQRRGRHEWRLLRPPDGSDASGSRSHGSLGNCPTSSGATLCWGERSIFHFSSVNLTAATNNSRTNMSADIHWKQNRSMSTYFWQNTCSLSWFCLSSLSSRHIQNYENKRGWRYFRHRDFYMNLENDWNQKPLLTPTARSFHGARYRSDASSGHSPNIQQAWKQGQTLHT